MALGNINIDDRTYEQLLAVLKQHIPTQEWRDHNPSDPGIMLLELLSWLGEMSLYRMNRVPSNHREKFLKLIADAPQAATALVTFTGALDRAVRPVEEPLVLPAGTRLATDFSNGRRYVFETLEALALSLPVPVPPGDPPLEGSVTAREFVIVDGQRIGESDGTADQVFAITPPRDVVETPDHPPQMSLPTGFSPAVVGGGKLGEGFGIAGITFNEVDLEEAHLLSYDWGTRNLMLERLGGSSETVAVPAGTIAASTTETVDFVALNGMAVILNEAFDKTADIEVDSAVVTITDGSGAIDDLSVKVVTARGLPQAQGSTHLTLSKLSTPGTAVITTAGGLSGVVNLATTGTRRVYLDDQWSRGFEIEFDVTAAFDGNETLVTIDLPALNNLFFLGTSENVSHSPWSEVLMDFVYRTAEYDPNPQIRVSAGFSPSLSSGGKVGAASGVAGVSFPNASMEEAFLLSYLVGPPRLRLQRPDGSVQTAPVAPSQVLPGTIETVDFSNFNVQVELNHKFDKTVPIDIDPAIVTVDFGTSPPLGTGAIDAGSVEIVSTRGLISALGSAALRLSNLSNPAQVVVTTDGGLRGTVDLSTVGSKIMELTDIWQRRFDVEFSVTTAFNGNEQSASIELHALENLFFLGKLWEARRSLRTEASLVDNEDPTSGRHCHVDPFDTSLRFGDGQFGLIPPTGADIVASYRVLQGPEALVRKNELEFLLDPPPRFATESLQFANEDGDGGLRFFAPDTRTAEALTDLNRTYRLVTAEDFEHVLLYDFNEFDIMAQAAPNVLSPDEIRKRRAEDPTIRRAVAMMNRDSALEEKRGHVAILVLTRLDSALNADLLHDELVPITTKQLAVDLDQTFMDRILRFLDERRLITTHPSLVSAQLKEVNLTTFVIVDRGRNVTEMTGTIRSALHDFFDIYAGYFDGEGWPLGRTVYQSEIFQLLEGVEGVDHVASLALSPADPNSDVALAPAELPILQNLTLSVDKA